MRRTRHQPRSEIPLFTSVLILLALTFFSIKTHQFLRRKLRDDNINRTKLSGRSSVSVEYHWDYELEPQKPYKEVEDEDQLEYKKKMDIIISQIQLESTILIQSLKEFSSPSCLLMKQDLETCERQKKNLELECKAIKTKLQNTEAELSSCKKTPG